MKETLDRLREKIGKMDNRAFFNPPATEKEIQEVEKRMNIRFPDSLHEFYLAYNGGFFADSIWKPEELEDTEKYETIQLNSNEIICLEDIKTGFGKRYAGYIPIIHTYSQEFLAVASTTGKGESPVLDAFHEFTPDHWGILYDNFEELLKDYIDKEGKIKTIAE